MIRPSDSDFPLFPNDYLSNLSFTWFEKGWLFGNNGAFSSLAQRPFYYLPTLMQWVGLSPDFVNIGTWFILLSLLGISAYIMGRILLPVRYSMAAIVTASFYMYNPYMTGEIYLGHWFTFYAYAAIPLVILGVIKGLDSGAQWKLWPALIAVLSIFIAHRVRLIPILLECIGIYLIYYSSTHKSWKNFRHLLSFVGLTTIAVLVVNLAWLLPSLGNFSTIYSLLTTPVINNSTPLSVSPTFADPLNVFKLVGYGIPWWHPTGIFYETGLGTFTTLALVVLSYSASIFRRGNYLVKYFTVTAVAFTLPMVLISQVKILSDTYAWLQGITPSPFNLLVFPESFEFWSVPIVLSYAFLLGVSVEGLASSIVRFSRAHMGRLSGTKIQRGTSTFQSGQVSNRSHFVSSTLLIGIILLSSLPLLKGVPNDFASPIQIPTYYQDARLWLSNQNPDFVILAVPRSQTLQYLKFDWAYNGRYSITDIFPQVSPVPVVSPNLPVGSREGAEIIDIAYGSMGTLPVQDLLSLMSVKYVVDRNDVVSSVPSIVRNFTALKGFYFEKRIGQLDFYRNQNYSPIVSASQAILPVWGSKQAFLPLLYYPNINFASTSFVFRDDISDHDFLSLLDHTSLLIDFDQPINDTVILDRARSGNLHLAYLLDNSPSAMTKVIQDGNYGETDILWNNNETRTTTFLEKGNILHLPDNQVPLQNSSFTIYGTSIPSDSVQAQTDESTNQTQIQWIADTNYDGFHALYLNLNKTAWNLPFLNDRGGGLALDVYGDGSGRELRFSFMDSGGRYFYGPLQTLYLDWTGWKRLYLPLSNFGQNGAPIWNDVVALGIWQDISSSSPSARIGIEKLTEDISPRFAVFSPVNGFAPASNETNIEFGWTKDSPVSYTIKATSSAPFVLRLNTAFDQGWSATMNGDALQHFRVNSYANGFYVPASTTPMQIKLNYEGQDLFVFGNYVSIGSLTLIGVFSIMEIRKSRRRPEDSVPPQSTPFTHLHGGLEPP